MIGTDLHRAYVHAKRGILRNNSSDVFGRHRDQCICSSRGLFSPTTTCPRHQRQIKSGAELLYSRKKKDEKS